MHKARLKLKAPNMRYGPYKRDSALAFGARIQGDTRLISLSIYIRSTTSNIVLPTFLEKRHLISSNPDEEVVPITIPILRHCFTISSRDKSLLSLPKDSRYLRPCVNENAVNLPSVNKFNPFDVCHRQ